MTRRTAPRQSDLTRAAKVANATGAVIVIETADGMVYRIAPAGVAVKDDDGLEAWRARKAQRANPRPL